MITYLRVIKNFEGTEEDGDSVAETNLPGILTCNGLIFVGKEHTTKSTKIYTPRKFLRVRYKGEALIFQDNFCHLEKAVCHLIYHVINVILSDAESRKEQEITCI